MVSDCVQCLLHKDLKKGADVQRRRFAVGEYVLLAGHSAFSNDRALLEVMPHQAFEQGMLESRRDRFNDKSDLNL